MKLHQSFLSLVVVSALFFSCERHEVIPAPEPYVEYDCSFSAIISDTISVLYSEGTDGYMCVANSTKVINSGSGAHSTAIYEMDIFSEDQSGGANIKHGKLEWNTSDNNPTLEKFEDYFNATTVGFDTDGDGGIEIIWYDDGGKTWVSDTMYNPGGSLANLPDSTNSFEYTKITQESDTMDYVLFEASFDCILFRTFENNGVLDTVRRKLEDGRFKGRYVRD